MPRMRMKIEKWVAVRIRQRWNRDRVKDMKNNSALLHISLSSSLQSVECFINSKRFQHICNQQGNMLSVHCNCWKYTWIYLSWESTRKNAICRQQSSWQFHMWISLFFNDTNWLDFLHFFKHVYRILEKYVCIFLLIFELGRNYYFNCNLIIWKSAQIMQLIWQSVMQWS